MLVEVEDTASSHMDMDNHNKHDITSVLCAICFLFSRIVRMDREREPRFLFLSIGVPTLFIQLCRFINSSFPRLLQLEDL